MVKALRVLVLLGVSLQLVTCSAIMLWMEPPPKDASVLEAGTSREEVIEELGPPERTIEATECHDEHLYEAGTSVGTKVFGTTAILVLDFFTMGVWELIAMPMTTAAPKRDVGIVVHYDSDMRIVKACVYQGYSHLEGKSDLLPVCDDDPCLGLQ